MKNGVFVQGLKEVSVQSAEEAINIFRKGIRNRHTSATEMNSESSRSHSIFTIVIQSKTKSTGGICKTRTSRLNLVDLAGSERQNQTRADGERLEEACYINKSLSVLSHVIMKLSTAAKSGKQEHVHFRDSTLTFLLRDSLGGNSKTCIIANISPAKENLNETCSTLKFAARAKSIKNRAHVNEDMTGNVQQLQQEIKLLKTQILRIREQHDEEKRKVRELESQLNGSMSQAPPTPSVNLNDSMQIDSELDTTRNLEDEDGHVWREKMEKTLVQTIELKEAAEEKVASLQDSAAAMIKALQAKTHLLIATRFLLKLKEYKLAALEGREPEIPRIDSMVDEGEGEQPAQTEEEADLFDRINRFIESKQNGLTSPFDANEVNKLVIEVGGFLMKTLLHPEMHPTALEHTLENAELQEKFKELHSRYGSKWEQENKEIIHLREVLNAVNGQVKQLIIEKHDLVEEMRNKENEIALIQESMHQSQLEKITELQTKIEDLEAMNRQFDAQMQQSLQQIHELRVSESRAWAERTEVEQQLLDAQSKLKQSNDKMLVVQGILDSSNAEVLNRDKRIKKLEDDIEAMLSQQEASRQQFEQERLQSQQRQQLLQEQARTEINQLSSQHELFVAQMRSEHDNTLAQLQASQQEVLQLRHQYSLISSELSSCKEDLSRISSSDKDLREQIVQTSQEAESWKQQLEQLNFSIQATVAEHHVTLQQNQISQEQLRQQLAAALAESSAARSELEAKEGQLSNMSEQIEQLRREVSLNNQTAELQIKLNHLHQRLAESNKSKVELEMRIEELRALEQSNAELKASSVKANEDLRSSMAAQSALTARNDALLSQNRALEEESMQLRTRLQEVEQAMHTSATLAQQRKAQQEHDKSELLRSEQQLEKAVSAYKLIEQELDGQKRQVQRLQGELEFAHRQVKVMESLQAENGDLQTREKELLVHISSLQQQLDALNGDANAQREEAQNLNNILKGEMGQVSMQRDLLAQRLQQLEGTELPQIQQELQLLRSSNQQLQEQVGLLQQSNQSFVLQQPSVELRQQVEDAEGRRRNAEAMLERVRHEFNLAMSNEAAAQQQHMAKVSALVTEIESNKLQINRLSRELADVRKKSSALQEENTKLKDDNAKLVGHQNHSQKIHYTQKIKEENNVLRKEKVDLELAITQRDQELVRLRQELQTTGGGKKRSDRTKPGSGKENEQGDEGSRLRHHLQQVAVHLASNHTADQELLQRLSNEQDCMSLVVFISSHLEVNAKSPSSPSLSADMGDVGRRSSLGRARTRLSSGGPTTPGRPIRADASGVLPSTPNAQQQFR